MSKQTPRQPSKRGQTANKQSNNLSSKPPVPANKQTTNVPLKQGRPDNKQTANAPVKRPGPANKPLTRQSIKQERREEEKRRRLEEQRRTARKKRNFLISIVAAVLVLAAAISIFLYANTHPATQAEQVVNPAYPPVDGVYCDKLEQTAYHIHAHLTIWINGQKVTAPQGVGIATDQSCLYWLHTHASNGVIHIEAPKKVSPNLGDFLDIWGKEFPQLGFYNELASSAGWTIYVDGRQVNSTFNQLVLQPHMVITIAYNSPQITPDTTYNWQQGE